jgi:hypothetical protein
MAKRIEIRRVVIAFLKSLLESTLKIYHTYYKHKKNAQKNVLKGKMMTGFFVKILGDAPGMATAGLSDKLKCYRSTRL